MLDNATVENLIARYDSPVPRYTSYPTALEFKPLEDAALNDSYQQCNPNHPFSVYIHLPFCENQCLYCGCNVLLSRRKDILDTYIPLLIQEIQSKTELLSFRPKISQLHFGGGTPNFLRLPDWDKLFEALRKNFDFNDNAEISVELDPMYLGEGYLNHLRTLGFNRVSYGVQDVTPKVLEAVNRPQDIDRIR
ncbi:MAG TPA: radical SAM protein, partial [Turneriella sp.]|nr:radical SAM protein [Turneriella sp.]